MSTSRFNSKVFHIWNDSKAQHRAEAARYRSQARKARDAGTPIYGGYASWCHMQCLRGIVADNLRLRAHCARGFC